MELIQTILVYLTLVIALGYLLKKFILPKRLFSTKKGNTTGCDDNCACH